MNRETVITALRAHESELRAAGVVRLSLFGSTARGEARPGSDIVASARAWPPRIWFSTTSTSGKPVKAFDTDPVNASLAAMQVLIPATDPDELLP
jgi:hypothetical protein